MRRLFVLLFGVVLWFGLNGCGGGGGSSDAGGGSGGGKPRITSCDGLQSAKGLVLKTGQTMQIKAFDDGFYQKGFDRHYYRDNTKNVVTDCSTKLMWQDDSDAEKIEKRWITMDSFIHDKYDDTTGDTATTYCENLELGGHSDWRLPTVNELSSLIDFDYTKTIVRIDDTFKHNNSKHEYWTATQFTDTQLARTVSFASGELAPVNKSQQVPVRCVRGGERRLLKASQEIVQMIL